MELSVGSVLSFNTGASVDQFLVKEIDSSKEDPLFTLQDCEGGLAVLTFSQIEEALARSQGHVDGENAGPLAEYIQALIPKLESREESDEEDEELDDDDDGDSRATASVALLSTELSKLQRSVSNHFSKTKNTLGQIPPVHLTTILTHLDANVKKGLRVKLIRHARSALEESSDLTEWLRSGLGGTMYRDLENALTAADIVVSFFNAEDFDRKLLAQDKLDRICDLVKLVVKDSLASVSTEHLETKTKTPVKRGRKTDSDDDADESHPSPHDSRPLIRALFRITESKVLPLIESIEKLVHRIRFDDKMILALSSAAFSTFPMKCDVSDISQLRALHVHSLNILQALFASYESHRQPIMDDMFGIMLKLPTSKKLSRTFTLHSLSKVVEAAVSDVYHAEGVRSIQAVSALLMLLIQSCVVDDAPAEAPPASTRSDSVEFSHGHLKKAFGATNYFLNQFLSRCQHKEDGSEYRTVLSNIVDDLLASLMMPEWPAAETILHLMCRALTSNIDKHMKEAIGGSSDSSGSQFMSFTLDILGKVSTRIRAIVRFDRENPVVLPPAVDLIDAEAAPTDEGQITGCRCTKGPKNLMLDCDRCHRWFHAECVGLSEYTEPTEWFCDDCKITKRVEAQKEMLADRRRRRRETQNERFEGMQEQSVPSSPIAGTKRKASHLDISVSESESDLSEIAFSDKDVFRQLILNSLTVRAHTEPWAEYARQFRIANWVSEDNKFQGDTVHAIEVADHFLDQWSCPLATIAQEEWQLTLDNVNTARISRKLVVSGEFVGRFDELLVSILSLLCDEAPTLRARVVKAIASIVDADPLLMANQNIREAMIQRFHDPAISVRQAAVDLVGHFSLLSEELFDQYYEALAERLPDLGVSVRKAVVKIFRDALVTHPNYHHRSKICRCLVQRAFLPKEEDSIKDLIRTTFQRLWFEGSSLDPKSPAPSTFSTPARPTRSSSLGSHQENALAALPDGWTCQTSVSGETFMSPSGKRCLSLEEALAVASKESESLAPSSTATPHTPFRPGETEIEAAAAQIVEVIHGVSNIDWFVSLIEGLLFGAGEGDKGKRQQKKHQHDVHTRCEKLVECCVEFLLRLEEGNPPLKNIAPSLSRSDSMAQLEGSPGSQLVAILSTLHMFCKASPILLSPHLHVLYPYLKAENHVSAAEEATICTKIANILSWALPLIDDTQKDQQSLSEVSNDLYKIAFKFGPATLQASIECLTIISGGLEQEDRSQLWALSRRFYSVLLGQVEKESISESNQTRAWVQRGLILLGFVCRYNRAPAVAHMKESEKTTPEEIPLPQPADLCSSNIHRSCYQLCKRFFFKQDTVVAEKAVQGFASLLVGAPRLMLVANHDKMIEGALAHESEVIRAQAVKCWLDVLEAEEAKVDHGMARRKHAEEREAEAMDFEELVAGQGSMTMSMRALETEASIVGGVLQMHISLVLQRLAEKKREIRMHALNLLGVMLRQGLVNPLQVLPWLLAMVGDIEPKIRAEATRLTLLEDEKHPDFLKTRFIEGVCQAYGTQMAVNGTTTPTVSEAREQSRPVSIFGGVYASCIRGNRQKRFDALRALVSVFEQKRAAETTQWLSQQPLTTLKRKKGVKQPLLDLKFLQFVAETLVSLPYGVQEEPLFVIYAINRYVSFEGSAILGQYKSDLSEASQLEMPESDEEDDDDFGSSLDDQLSANQNLKSVVVQSAGLCILLRVKHYLKDVYRLNDQKCQDYIPNESTRATEKTISHSDSFPPFSLPESFADLDLQKLTVKQAVSQFLVYRSHLREDPKDFKLVSRVQSKAGRKRQTSEKGGRQSSAKKPKKKPKKKPSEQEVDMEDDEYYEY